VQLQEETDKLEPQPLEGWKVLLLWIPAACDLTGTTVSLRRYSARQVTEPVLPDLIMRPSFPVNECWPLIYPRLDLSNDPRGPCPVCRGIQCSISPAPPLALPVSSASIFFLKYENT